MINPRPPALSPPIGEAWDSCVLCGGSKTLVEVQFDSGSIEPTVGETITGATSGATGVVSSVDLISGAWNEVANGGFEDWTGGAPDSWSISGAGATATQESTIIKAGTYSVAIARNGADTTLQQACYSNLGLSYWKGRTVTARAWVYATVANRARIAISDGYSGASSSFHTGGSTWENLTASYTISQNATTVLAILQVLSGDTTAYFDSFTLPTGTTGTIVMTSPTGISDEGLWGEDDEDINGSVGGDNILTLSDDGFSKVYARLWPTSMLTKRDGKNYCPGHYAFRFRNTDLDRTRLNLTDRGGKP